MGYGTNSSAGGTEGRRRKRVAAAAAAAATFTATLTCLAALAGPQGPAAVEDGLSKKAYGNIILQDNRATLSQPYYPYPSVYAASTPFAVQQRQLLLNAAEIGLPRQSGRPVVHPMGYYQNLPVWHEEPRAAYVDQAQPERRFAWGQQPPPLIRKLRQLPARLPAAAAVERFLTAQHGWGELQDVQPGLAVGLTGNAAAQYGAAYGAAFASTYNSLLLNPAMGRSKHGALNRLQRKAAAAVAKVGRPAPKESPVQRKVMQVQVMPAGWRMPPLTRTGTAVVEQALMSPSEVQVQQKNAPGSSRATLDLMSATGGPRDDVSMDAGQSSGSARRADPLQTAEGAVAEAEAADKSSFRQPADGSSAATSSLAELV